MNYFYILTLITIFNISSFAQTWEVVTAGPENVQDVFLSGEQKVLAVSRLDTSVFISQDAGSTWSAIPLNFSPSVSMIFTADFYFLDNNNGWLALKSNSYQQYLFRTSDGGNTWAQIYFNSNASLNTIYFKDADNGWALNGWVGEVWETNDGGQSWSVILNTTLTSGYPNSIQFIDNDTGWIAGYRAIFRTTDGGNNWTETVLGQNLNSISFYNSMEGYASAFEYGNFYKTLDGGVSWTLHFQDTALPEMRSVFFKDAMTGYWSGGIECRFGSCHGEPRILKTNDGGLTWNHMTQPAGWLQAPNKDYVKVTFTDGGTGWMISSDDKLLKLDATVGVNKIKTLEGVRVYPNPTSDFTMVDNLQNLSLDIEIYTQTGQLVCKRYTDTDIRIDLRDLNTGVYFMKVISGNKMMVENIVRL
jgi:photosystem II stability/assembly factor-like uncharacterized protein